MLDEITQLTKNCYYYLPNNREIIESLYRYSLEGEEELFKLKILEEGLEEIPSNIIRKCNFSTLDKKIDYIINENPKKSSSIDQYIGPEIKNLIDIDRFEASNNQFWNGIVFGNVSLLRLCCFRWKIDNQTEFLTKFAHISRKQNSGKRSRVFVGSGNTFQRKHTFARLWWSCEICLNKKQYIDLLLQSQDAIDRILEADFLNDEISPYFFEAWNKFERQQHIIADAWKYIVRFGKQIKTGILPSEKENTSKLFENIFEFSIDKVKQSR